MVYKADKKHPEYVCPHCDTNLGKSAPIHATDDEHKDGDVGLCGWCGKLFVLDLENNKLRPLSEELAKALIPENIYQQMLTARKIIDKQRNHVEKQRDELKKFFDEEL